MDDIFSSAIHAFPLSSIFQPPLHPPFHFPLAMAENHLAEKASKPTPLLAWFLNKCCDPQEGILKIDIKDEVKVAKKKILQL